MVDEPKRKVINTKIIGFLQSLAKQVLVLLLLVVAVDLFRGWYWVSNDHAAESFSLPSFLHPNSSETTIPAHGEATLIYFSAPWCGVCAVTGNNLKKSSEFLNKLGWSHKAFEVSLSYTHREELERYSQELGKQDFLLGHEEVAKSYRIDSFPTFFFIGSDGKVVANTTGFTSTFGLVWRSLLYL